MKSSLSTLFILALCAASAGAQTEASLRPQKPILHRAPSFACWTINFKYKDEDVPKASGTPPPFAANRVHSITVTKTDKTYWEKITLASGTIYEKWTFNGVQLMSIPNTPAIAPIEPPAPDNPSPDYSDYGKSDFPGLEWVSMENFKDLTTDQQKVQAFRFEQQGKTAFLSAETQLPLNFSDSELIRTYTFNSPPSSPLVPPERFQKVLETHKNGLESLKYRPSPP